MASNNIPRNKLVPHHVGGWLPKDHRVIEKWLSKKIAKVEKQAADGDEHLAPVILEFKRFIESDPIIYMGFHQMFEQVPTKPPYDKDPTGKPQVSVSLNCYPDTGADLSL